MPIYEYECTKCAKVEEFFQKLSDTPLDKCKHCGGKLHKLISHSSFHLKGTGWYATDYANKSNTKGTTPRKTDKAKASQKSTPASQGKTTKSSSDGSAS